MRRAVPDLTSIKPPRAADGAGTAKGETMKIIVIGATGTIGSEVVKALSLKRHEVVRASRNGEVKVTLDDPASVRALFERVRNVDAVVFCAGNAAFKPFADLTDADYELGLRSKLMGQVSLARGEGRPARQRLDHPDHGRPRDAADAGKRVYFARQRRPRRFCARRGAGDAARASDQRRQPAVGEGDDGEVRHGPDPRPRLGRRRQGLCRGGRRLAPGRDSSGDSICLMARGLRRRSGRPRASSSAGPSATVRAPARVTHQKSRMRESCKSGSVGEAAGDRRFYPTAWN